MSAPPPTRSTTEVRFDIQGLRAFAVAAVVLYHLWPNRLPGGFAGVDVFFVVSGFLITSHLVREVDSTGRLRLGTFWTRRAKRLLPSSFLTILATAVASWLLVPQNLWNQYFNEVISATLYFQNWHLAASSVDYLARSNQPSPFQHLWSLSVEEQFYIALPLALVALLALRKRIALPIRRLVQIFLVVVIALSFVWCVIETTTSPGVAYFSTATRAWEFALGGLASTITIEGRRIVSRVTRLVGEGALWIGGALLVLSLWAITPASPFPGWIAALPVVGTVLLLLFGADSDFALVGRVRPIAFLGRISYALYLWHWPLVILWPFATGHELTTRDKLAIIVLSLALGAATTLLIEEPLRFSERGRRLRPRRIAVLGLAASVALVGLGAGTLVGVAATDRSDSARADVLAAGIPCFGAAALISAPTPCENPALDSTRVPGITRVLGDDDNMTACWSKQPGEFKVCSLGDTKAPKKKIFAVGDSHNNTLIGAYKKIAAAYDWQIDVAGHGGCYWTDAEQTADSRASLDACNVWKGKLNDYIASHSDYDAIFTTHSSYDFPVPAKDGASSADRTVAGLVSAWSVATDRGTPVIALVDNPHVTNETVNCIAKMHGPTTSACDTSRAAALRDFDGQAQAVKQVDGAHLIDLNQYACTADRCPAVIGGVIVHRDASHYTATFARTLAPYLGTAIDEALRSAS